LILTAGISDPRKGFAFLRQALEAYVRTPLGVNAELLVMGAHNSSMTEEEIKTHFLGIIHDDVSLALAYSAADVFVSPSLEDNLPNTVMEAMACGTPCIGFNVGGIPEMISHRENGYVAVSRDSADLMAGLEWVIGDPKRHLALGSSARQKVESDYTLELQARRYLELFQDILRTEK
jgi:glycosyltransferase involved in cell wall biosynthesis